MLVHLIYVHGFQGNDTTFQSFPTHLQQYLASHVAPNRGIEFKTSLYPTYKSVKPISYAMNNFLEWLSTQPPGPVILLGHSMGGLLVAEAATHASNNTDDHPGAKPRRIKGVIAFDTPYLGMHPHVVKSGIASLFQKDEGEEKKSEKEMNPHKDVSVVSPQVTDDWEKFKTHNFTSPPSTLAPSPSHVSNGRSAPALRPPSPFLDHAISFVSEQSNHPLLRWLRKHSNDLLGDGRKWFVDRFQFGSCMFDPVGLKERYAQLVGWRGGLWVNYWTQTSPETHGKAQKIGENLSLVADNDMALRMVTGIGNHSESPSLEGSHQETPETGEIHSSSKSNKRKEISTPRHFVVLPTGLGKVLGGGEKWEMVPIAGVHDEVAAHCGLFIPGQNLDYDGFVERVGLKVLNWCEYF